MVKLPVKSISNTEVSYKYETGEIFVATIASVLKNGLDFYVVANQDPLLFSEEFSEMFWIPMIFESFLLNSTSNGILRCIRVPLDDNSLDPKVFMKIYLMDTGESFIHSIVDMPDDSLFEMPDSLKKVPDRAIRCRWNEVEVEHQLDNDFTFIANSLHKKFTFEVVEVIEDELVVNVLPYDDSSSLELMSIVENKENTEEVEAEVKFRMTELAEGVTKEAFTEKELEILNEEPLNTGNPLLAVQGFVTRDDDRLCKFFDPEIGGCFKGGRCKQRHQLEIRDGTCRDVSKDYYLGIPKVLPLPLLHSMIRIKITYFYSVNRFLCRYARLKPSKAEIGFDSLVDLMNEDENVKLYRTIKILPSFKQLVLYKSADGKFYRARVESLPDEDMNVELLLVDLGIIEIASQSQIYNWCNQFNFISFQAVEMEIVNIEPLSDNTEDEEGIEIIRKHQEDFNNSMKVSVFDNIGGIKVKLFNKDDEDIGQELVDRKLALKKAVEPPKMDQIVIAA